MLGAAKMISVYNGENAGPTQVLYIELEFSASKQGLCGDVFPLQKSRGGGRHGKTPDKTNVSYIYALYRLKWVFYQRTLDNVFKNSCLLKVYSFSSGLRIFLLYIAEFLKIQQISALLIFARLLKSFIFPITVILTD